MTIALSDVAVESPMEVQPEIRLRGEQLHVVHGVLSLDLGGLERLVVDLAKMGRQRGYRVSVVCIEHPGLLAETAKSVGAEVYSLGKPAGRSGAAVDQAAALLQQLQPDVVHTHQIGALWYLGQAAKRLGGIAVLHTEHSDHVAHAKTWWQKFKTRVRWLRMSRLVGRFCCVSEDIASSARRWGTVPRAKVQVVLNGIDPSVYADSSQRDAVRAALGIAADASVIGTVGRLVEVKRQDVLIRAVALLRGQFPQVRLLLIGDGTERRALEALAGQLSIQDAVVFAGYQEHPERFFQAMDVFALSSRHEGLPLSLLEAWAAGLPIVSSAVGAIPQTVEHGVTGLLYPSCDEKALALLLARLLNASEVARELGRRGREQVGQRFSLARMADEYERQYRQLIAA